MKASRKRWPEGGRQAHHYVVPPWRLTMVLRPQVLDHRLGEVHVDPRTSYSRKIWGFMSGHYQAGRLNLAKVNLPLL